jgi:hypothetical protein
MVTQRNEYAVAAIRIPLVRKAGVTTLASGMPVAGVSVVEEIRPQMQLMPSDRRRFMTPRSIWLIPSLRRTFRPTLPNRAPGKHVFVPSTRVQGGSIEQRTPPAARVPQ